MVFMCLSQPVVATKIYTWVDENGVTHYTENKPEAEDNNVKEMEIKSSSKAPKNKVSSNKYSTSSVNSDKNCVHEPEPGYDKASERNIWDYYRTRIKQCKQFYRAGSFQIKNCKQEQKEIKAEKLKKHKEWLKKRCK